MSPALEGGFFIIEPLRKPQSYSKTKVIPPVPIVSTAICYNACYKENCDSDLFFIISAIYTEGRKDKN